MLSTALPSLIPQNNSVKNDNQAKAFSLNPDDRFSTYYLSLELDGADHNIKPNIALDKHQYAGDSITAYAEWRNTKLDFDGNDNGNIWGSTQGRLNLGNLASEVTDPSGLANSGNDNEFKQQFNAFLQTTPVGTNYGKGNGQANNKKSISDIKKDNKANHHKKVKKTKKIKKTNKTTKKTQAPKTKPKPTTSANQNKENQNQNSGNHTSIDKKTGYLAFSFPGNPQNNAGKDGRAPTQTDLNKATAVSSGLVADFNQAMNWVYVNKDEIFNGSGYKISSGSLTNAEDALLALKTASLVGTQYISAPMVKDAGKNGTSNNLKYIVTLNDDGSKNQLIYGQSKGYGNIQGGKDFSVNGKILTWPMVATSAVATWAEGGVTYDTSAAVSKPDILTQGVTNLFTSAINGLESLAGIPPLQDLIFNTGNRSNGATYYGVSKQSWFDATTLVTAIFSALALFILAIALAKNLFKYEQETLTVAQKITLYDDIKDMAITLGLLILYPWIFMALAKGNYYITHGLAALAGANSQGGWTNNQVWLQITKPISNIFGLGAILLALGYFVINIYYFYFYTFRSFMILALHTIAPLYISALALGDQYKPTFVIWFKELIGDIYEQSFQAFIFAFFVKISVLGSVSILENIFILLAIIPLTKWFRRSLQIQASPVSELANGAMSYSAGLLSSVGNAGGGGGSGSGSGGSGSGAGEGSGEASGEDGSGSGSGGSDGNGGGDTNNDDQASVGTPDGLSGSLSQLRNQPTAQEGAKQKAAIDQKANSSTQSPGTGGHGGGLGNHWSRFKATPWSHVGNFAAKSSLGLVRAGLALGAAATGSKDLQRALGNKGALGKRFNNMNHKLNDKLGAKTNAAMRNQNSSDSVPNTKASQYNQAKRNQMPLNTSVNNKGETVPDKKAEEANQAASTIRNTDQQNGDQALASLAMPKADESGNIKDPDEARTVDALTDNDNSMGSINPESRVRSSDKAGNIVDGESYDKSTLSDGAGIKNLAQSTNSQGDAETVATMDTDSQGNFNDAALADSDYGNDMKATVQGFDAVKDYAASHGANNTFNSDGSLTDQAKSALGSDGAAYEKGRSQGVNDVTHASDGSAQMHLSNEKLGINGMASDGNKVNVSRNIGGKASAGANASNNFVKQATAGTAGSGSALSQSHNSGLQKKSNTAPADIQGQQEGQIVKSAAISGSTGHSSNRVSSANTSNGVSSANTSNGGSSANTSNRVSSANTSNGGSSANTSDRSSSVDSGSTQEQSQDSAPDPLSTKDNGSIEQPEQQSDVAQDQGQDQGDIVADDNVRDTDDVQSQDDDVQATDDNGNNDDSVDNIDTDDNSGNDNTIATDDGSDEDESTFDADHTEELADSGDSDSVDDQQYADLDDMIAHADDATADTDTQADNLDIQNYIDDDK